MADNISVTPGTGKTIAADDVGGALYQRVKLAAGADGVATDVSAAAPLPVIQTGTPDLPTGAATAANQATGIAHLATLAGAVGGTEIQVDVLTMPTTTVTGTVAITAAALPLPTGAATSANQGTAIGHLATIAGVAGDALTDTELRATPVPVSGTVTVQDGGGAITVDGTVTVTGVATAANQSTEIGHLATLAGAVAGTEVQVDVLSIAAGENLIGLVGTSDIVITVTPTCHAGALASGDLFFDSTEVANAVRANGYSCVLQSLTIIDKDDQGAAFTVYIADAATDFGTLDSAPDADDTEAATVIGWVPVATTDYVDLGAAKVACIRNIGLTLKAGASTTSLYIAGVNGTGTPTYSASGLVFKLGFLRS